MADTQNGDKRMFIVLQTLYSFETRGATESERTSRK